MIEIKKEILEKYGIYETRKIKEEEKNKLLKLKKKIEEKIEITIEKMYIINDYAWGKITKESVYDICILIDKRYKDLEEIREKIEEISAKEKIGILYWSLSQFERRKNTGTEEDYYIYRYGIKIYDSDKKSEINEKVEKTKYAIYMDYHKLYGELTLHYPERYMSELLKIYTLKIGYNIITKKVEIDKEAEFVKMITKDEKVIEIIERFLKAEDKENKKKICIEFEQYIQKVKQVRIQMQLDEKPTMEIYKKLKNKKENGETLDINTLTEEDLYTMYIIEEKSIGEIAELYNVNQSKITYLKDRKWNIRLKEKTITNSGLIEKIIKENKPEKFEYTYALFKKIGIMNFEKCLKPILEYMYDGNIYLLKELWRFTKIESSEFEKIVLEKETNSFYRATLCIDLLMQNGLIEEVDFKQYKITQKGKDLINYCYRNNKKEINIPTIYERFKKVKYYGLFFNENCKVELEKIEWKKLYKKWNSYCTKYFPELLDGNNLPIDKKIDDTKIEDPEQIAASWQYLFFSKLRDTNQFPEQWEKELFISATEITQEIYKILDTKTIKLILKENVYNKFLDVSNLCKYIEIEKIEEIIEYVASSCAYLIKIME